MSDTNKPVSPLLVTIASILVPGLGYWLIGQRKRALITGGGVIVLFALGILIAGVRVINFPGYEDGYKKYVELRQHEGPVFTTQPAVAVAPGDAPGQMAVTRIGTDGKPYIDRTDDPPVAPSQWVLVQAPISQIGDNISFLGQVLNGPLCAVAGYLSNVAARAGVPRSYTRLADIGALYTAISGMLNLMLIVDCLGRASRLAQARETGRLL